MKKRLLIVITIILFITIQAFILPQFITLNKADDNIGGWIMTNIVALVIDVIIFGICAATYKWIRWGNVCH